MHLNLLAEVAAIKGWRRDIFGARALKLKHGHFALTIENGKVATLEWQETQIETQIAGEMDQAKVA